VSSSDDEDDVNVLDSGDEGRTGSGLQRVDTKDSLNSMDFAFSETAATLDPDVCEYCVPLVCYRMSTYIILHWESLRAMVWAPISNFCGPEPARDEPDVLDTWPVYRRTCCLLHSLRWYSFTDPGGMEG
jgi:hypothetical protein